MSEAPTSLPSLFERLQQAREQVSTLVSRRNEKQEARRFEERAQQLKTPAELLRKAASHATVLTDASVEIQGIDSEALRRWHARLQDMLTEFEKDPASILDFAPGENPKIVFFAPLGQVAAELNNNLLLSWQNWVKDRVPTIPAELLQVLVAVPALAMTVAAIRAAQAKLRQAAESLPLDVSAVEEVQAIVEQLSGMWESLSGGEIPDAVIAFLRAAGQREGAVFSLLTSDVSAWLQHHALLDTLKIRLS